MAGHRGLADAERRGGTGSDDANSETARPRDGPRVRAAAFSDQWLNRRLQGSLGHHERRSRYSASDPEFSLIGPGVNASNMRSRGLARQIASMEAVARQQHSMRPSRFALWCARSLWISSRRRYRAGISWSSACGKGGTARSREPADADPPFRRRSLVPDAREISETSDLIAGDSFGDPVSTGPHGLVLPVSKGSMCSRLTADANQATIRIRYHGPSHMLGRLGDRPDGTDLVGKRPISSGWNCIILNVPKVADIQAVLRTMTPEERNAAVIRARTLVRVRKGVRRRDCDNRENPEQA